MADRRPIRFPHLLAAAVFTPFCLAAAFQGRWMLAGGLAFLVYAHVVAYVEIKGFDRG